MNFAFADTFYWYGLCNPRDQWHRVVQTARLGLGERPVVTTDEVLVEFASAMAADRYLRGAAQLMIDALLTDPNITVVPQTHDSFLSGWELYTNRPDKHYSLVDCISMACCRAHGITEILTNDHHFEQEGFVVLLKR